MLATLSNEPVEGKAWIFEEKYDGIRAIAERKKDRVRLYSRTGQDLTAGFSAIVARIRALPDDDLALDGELVVFDRAGVSRFQMLQRRGVDPQLQPSYVVFDVLRSRRRDFRKRPLEERRARLLELIPKRQGVLRPSRVLPGSGAAALATARENGWEGVIAKQRGTSYEPGRSHAWRKVKVRGESEFVIGGYTPPQGARSQFGALMVGLFDGPKLRFVGKVGTGYTQQTLRDVGAKLRRLRTERVPFEPAPRLRDATWVRPALVAQLAYQEWTAGGKLRQPAFLGLRTDKQPAEVTWKVREP